MEDFFQSIFFYGWHDNFISKDECKVGYYIRFKFITTSTIQDFWASIETDLLAYNNRYTQNIYINTCFSISKIYLHWIISGHDLECGERGMVLFFYITFHCIEFWTSATLAGTLLISFDLIYLAFMNRLSVCFWYQLYICVYSYFSAP